MQLTEFEQKSLERLQKATIESKISNDGLIQIIEQAGSFLNLQTVSDYKRKYKMSYNGVSSSKGRTIRKIFNVKFVIDNN